MPSKNSIKTYVKDGYYHIYNRGVNKQLIFFEDADFTHFLFLLKLYLSSLETAIKELAKYPALFHYLPQNYYQQLHIICFCLMPNHFHLVVKQSEPHVITHFIHALMTKYVMYINHKYERCGPLFQSIYKGVLIDHDSYLLYLSRYIHLNPLELPIPVKPIKKEWSSFEDYPYSSYKWYLSNVHTEWFHPSIVLDFFTHTNVFNPNGKSTYQSFVNHKTSNIPDNLKGLTLDS